MSDATRAPEGPASSDGLGDHWPMVLVSWAILGGLARTWPAFLVDVAAAGLVASLLILGARCWARAGQRKTVDEVPGER